MNTMIIIAIAIGGAVAIGGGIMLSQPTTTEPTPVEIEPSKPEPTPVEIEPSKPEPTPVEIEPSELKSNIPIPELLEIFQDKYIYTWEYAHQEKCDNAKKRVMSYWNDIMMTHNINDITQSNIEQWDNKHWDKKRSKDGQFVVVDLLDYNEYIHDKCILGTTISDKDYDFTKLRFDDFKNGIEPPPIPDHLKNYVIEKHNDCNLIAETQINYIDQIIKESPVIDKYTIINIQEHKGIFNQIYNHYSFCNQDNFISQELKDKINEQAEEHNFEEYFRALMQ